jgi:hypothetical protein
VEKSPFYAIVMEHCEGSAAEMRQVPEHPYGLNMLYWNIPPD